MLRSLRHQARPFTKTGGTGKLAANHKPMATGRRPPIRAWCKPGSCASQAATPDVWRNGAPQPMRNAGRECLVVLDHASMFQQRS
jgi:hypothetical protein